MKKNIAVIGCGYWGKNLVRNFHEIGALAAVCDFDYATAEKFAEQYGVRELQLIPIKEEEEFEGGEIQFESVDQIVLAQLDTIESNTVQKDVLVEIYNSIET